MRSEKWLYYLLNSLGILFLLFGYFLLNIYYFPTNNGILGDNYFHLIWSIEDTNFLKPHHPLYPLLASKFNQILTWIGILPLDHPNYLELYYTYASLPIKIAMVSALFVFGQVVSRINTNLNHFYIIFFFGLSSYGFWIWGLHSNAIGLAIALQLFTYSLIISWYHTKKTWLLAVASLLNAVTVLAHGGSIYFAMGSMISIVILITNNKSNWLKRSRQLSLALIIPILMALAFYFLESWITKIDNPIKLYQFLKTSEYFEEYPGTQFDTWELTRSNLVTSAKSIINHYGKEAYPIWSSQIETLDKSVEEKALRAVQIILGFCIILSSTYFRIRTGTKPQKCLFVLGLVGSLVYHFGFPNSMSGTHYYVFALVPNVTLLASFILSIQTTPSEKKVTYSLITLFVLANVFYNTLTTQSIIRFRNLADHPYYAISQNINDNLEPNKKAIYFGDIDVQYYPNASLVDYYDSKYGHIEWVWEPSLYQSPDLLIQRIYDSLSSKKRVFLGESAAAKLKNSPLKLGKITEAIYSVDEL